MTAVAGSTVRTAAKTPLANVAVDGPTISDDGRYVVYQSNSTDYVTGVNDGNGQPDVFLYDRLSRTTTLVSHQSVSPNVAGNDASILPQISGDGRYVAYESYATSLADGQIDVPTSLDVFLFDRVTGTNRLVSHTPASATTASAQTQAILLDMAVSGDGSFVAFSSLATNLVEGDRNNSYDLFGYSTSAAAPIAVQSVQVNDGSPQRSIVTNLTVAFSTLVTLPANLASAFRLTRTGPGGPVGDVALAVDLSGSTALQTVVRLTFSGPLTQFGSLIDGNYTLTVLGSQVSGSAGALLDGDADGTPGGDSVTALFRLFGDVNGDKAVNGLDVGAFRTSFGTARGDANYNLAFDFDGDGVINGTDLIAFRSRFGMVLP